MSAWVNEVEKSLDMCSKFRTPIYLVSNRKLQEISSKV